MLYTTQFNLLSIILSFFSKISLIILYLNFDEPTQKKEEEEEEEWQISKVRKKKFTLKPFFLKKLRFQVLLRNAAKFSTNCLFLSFQISI